ncbi:MAG: AAA family ATPase [Armatimonadota bacterium]|nr:AAA family ATPase [Armatimonadota bacterium]
MAAVIAVTGKGGVGKTTVAALVVRALVEAGKGAVLAVDADPNLNLDTALGLKAMETVGDVREEGLDRTATLPGGMAKAQFLELRIQEALVESKGFDLLVMGRPEGPGCYCFANSILRACVDEIGKQYRYIVIDCEAGLEHLSRRTAGDVDVLILLSDLSVRGLDTAARVLELVGELGTKVGKKAFAFTRPADGIPPELQAAAKERGLPEPHVIPEDPELRALDMQGKPLVAVSESSAALEAVRGILKEAGVLTR